MRCILLVCLLALALGGCSALAPPQTYAECIQRTQGTRYHYNTGGVIGAVVIGIADAVGRVIERSRCKDQFAVGTARRLDDKPSEAADTSKIPVLTDDRKTAKAEAAGSVGGAERYAGSTVKGSAFSAISDVEYGQPVCRTMNGAVHPSC